MFDVLVEWGGKLFFFLRQNSKHCKNHFFDNFIIFSLFLNDNLGKYCYGDKRTDRKNNKF